MVDELSLEPGGELADLVEGVAVEPPPSKCWRHDGLITDDLDHKTVR
jgi:hypothetical protein